MVYHREKLYFTIYSLYLSIHLLLITNITCDSCRFTDDSIELLHSSNESENRTEQTLHKCSTICPRLKFRATCSCYLIGSDNARLECTQSNASILVSDIEQLNSCGINLAQLIVTNSNLIRLYHLPFGLDNVEELVLVNTGIDLETLRESNELLRRLKVLRISAENLTEIPETLFTGMDELRELSLNNLGMAYINVDAFVPLQDSLEILELRSNLLRTIPNAVQILSKLECLDLRNNDIKSTLADANALISLKRLKRLRMHLSKCSCEFGKTRFATWLRTYAIKGVTCPEIHHAGHSHSYQNHHRQSSNNKNSKLFMNLSPEPYALLQHSQTIRSIDRDVSNSPVEDFCEPSFNSQTSLSQFISFFIFIPFFLFYMIYIF